MVSVSAALSVVELEGFALSDELREASLPISRRPQWSGGIYYYTPSYNPSGLALTASCS